MGGKSCNLSGQKNHATSRREKRNATSRDKKSGNLSGRKNHAASRGGEKITQPFGTTKNHAASQNKKIMQPLRTKKIHAASQNKKITQPLKQIINTTLNTTIKTTTKTTTKITTKPTTKTFPHTLRDVVISRMEDFSAFLDGKTSLWHDGFLSISRSAHKFVTPFLN